MNIRKAIVKDAQKLNELLTKLIHEEKKYDNNINDEVIINSYYENIIEKSNNIILVAEIDNKVVGYLYGFILDEGDTVINKTAKIDAVYIEELYRRKGAGGALIDKFKEWCSEQKVKYIEIKVLNDNEVARSLYIKKCFESIKTTMRVNL